MLLKHNRGISSVVAMFIAVGVVIAGVSYWLLFINNMEDDTVEVMEKEDAMMDKDDVGDSMLDDEVMDDETMMEEDHSDEMDQKDNTTPPNNNNQSQNNPPPEESTNEPGVYMDYSADALAQAQTQGKKPVLFFWAAWCPFCRAANEDFNANLNRIPSNVVLLKTNYDTESQLKTKYGITYQHTFVQVDSSGNQVTKWSGGGINELLTNVK